MSRLNDGACKKPKASLKEVMEDNSKIFLKTFLDLAVEDSFSPEECEILKMIAKNHLLDLTTNLQGYFDHDLRLQITQVAATKLLQAVKDQGRPLQSFHWQRVVENYHRNGYWGLRPSKTQLPEKPAADTPAREMFRYIWVFLQAGILMKAVVLYFGLGAAADDKSSSSLFLYFALAFSFGSLIFFAWRLHKKSVTAGKQD